MEFFTIAICAIPYQLNWEIIFAFYIVNLNTTMFLFLLYHLSKRDTMPRTRYSKYSESIVTILNVLCSLGLLFRSPELTGIHQLCSFFSSPEKQRQTIIVLFFKHIKQTCCQDQKLISNVWNFTQILISHWEELTYPI